MGLTMPQRNTALITASLFPVDPPHQQAVMNGQFYSGSPFLGTMGSLPPGEGGFNPNSGFLFMWHSHSEKEITNNDIFPGGMLTMMIIEPPRCCSQNPKKKEEGMMINMMKPNMMTKILMAFAALFLMGAMTQAAAVDYWLDVQAFDKLMPDGVTTVPHVGVTLHERNIWDLRCPDSSWTCTYCRRRRNPEHYCAEQPACCSAGQCVFRADFSYNQRPARHNCSGYVSA